MEWQGDRIIGVSDYNGHITSNKLDIVFNEKDTDKCPVIDVAIPSEYNIQKKAMVKIRKYMDLQIKKQRIWNKKVEHIDFSFCVVL